MVKNDYHTGVIRSTLTRNLVKLFPDIRDEINRAFSEIIPIGDNDGTSIWLYYASMAHDQDDVDRVGKGTRHRLDAEDSLPDKQSHLCWP